MAKRRTRSEKIKASLRQSQLTTQLLSLATQASLAASLPTISLPIPPPQTPPWSGTLLDFSSLRKDLLRSLLAIVLALALEIGVYYILKSGEGPRFSKFIFSLAEGRR